MTKRYKVEYDAVVHCTAYFDVEDKIAENEDDLFEFLDENKYEHDEEEVVDTFNLEFEKVK